MDLYFTCMSLPAAAGYPPFSFSWAGWEQREQKEQRSSKMRILIISVSDPDPGVKLNVFYLRNAFSKFWQ